MKKKLFLIPALLVLTLTSCRETFFGLFDDDNVSKEDVPLNEDYVLRETNVYNTIDQESKVHKSRMKIDTVNLLFQKGDTYVPYISIDEFLKLYKGVSSGGFNIQKDGFVTDVYVTKGGYTRFQFSVDESSRVFSIGGSLDSVVQTSTYYSESSLSLGAHDTGTDILDLVENEGVTDFAMGEVYNNIIHINEVSYFPFSILSGIFYVYSSLTFFYNYQDIFCYEDFDAFEVLQYRTGQKTTTALGEMDERVGHDEPENVRNNRYLTYYYILKNFCGLKYSRNINMAEVFEQVHLENLKSESSIIRNQTVADLAEALDDRHNYFDRGLWEEGFTNLNPNGPQKIKARESGTAITEVRNESFRRMDKGHNEILYSSDGSTALFILDSFSNIYSGSDVKRVGLDKLADADDFFYMRKQLETIKQKGGVKDVIIDITLNGGGYVYSLFKMCCLLNKTNDPLDFDMMDATSEAIGRYSIKIDSNLDGEYNNDDVYGDEFNFYIMASAYSYSCANAFSYFAEKHNLATNIGETSGGGECAVYAYLMPTGEIVYFSSLLRIGYYENYAFEGDERGGTVIEKYQIPATSNDRYNLDYLKEFIK